jgi:IS4 transposase
LYDRQLQAPIHFSITSANVNDITEGKKIPLESGGIYIYDKGYFDYDWWNSIVEKGSAFVTRIKKNTPYEITKVYAPKGDNVLSDTIIELAAEKARRKFKHPLRMVEIILDNGELISVVTNKLTLNAEEIAKLYRQRWEIELLFKWLKQNLQIKRFWCKNENGVKLQIITALIAFVLLRLVQLKAKTILSVKYILQLISLKLFETSTIYSEIRKINGNASCKKEAL